MTIVFAPINRVVIWLLWSAVLLYITYYGQKYLFKQPPELSPVPPPPSPPNVVRRHRLIAKPRVPPARRNISTLRKRSIPPDRSQSTKSRDAEPTPELPPYHPEDSYYSPPSSNRPFRDLYDRALRTVRPDLWGPPLPSTIDQLGRKTGCHIATVPFDPSEDDRCIDYMSNLQNWKTVKPLPAVYSARTVKFSIEFVDTPLRAILKVPQKKHPIEPYSEYAAFEADRLLHYHRVPPTAWVYVPIRTLEEVVEASGKDLTVRPDDVQFNSTSWYEWVQVHFFDYVERKQKLQRDRRGTYVLGVSVQLWVADVAELLDSVYRIPYKEVHRQWHFWFDPSRYTIPDYFAMPLHHLAQQMLFDWVIGNDDRSPNKNSYVVGGCASRYCRGSGVSHPGPPYFVYIDQGMAFYDDPERAVFMHNDSFCIFRRRSVDHLKRFVGPQRSFASAFASRLPTEVFRSIGGSKVMEECQSRVERALRQVSSCLRRFPKSAVIVP
eukprot:NODE_81_length_2424_cov_65.736178_g60_i0.p1 GENE.NODE_81_length_2424_cov_65.736178_g60_i0~~NODE_81_length_2424_cov_65.736178_g60_i0.p1  ORF type:complete len:493 (+),score=43.67 NODE_81_length_2424_cov_65.736178_g60_i0:178-1656(+)